MLVCVVLSQCIVPSVAFAADLFVGGAPGDYPTIEAALTAASDGDTVIMREGRYSESVTIDKPGITLTSEFGAEVTVDGDITVSAAAGGVELVGFTFRAASAMWRSPATPLPKV